jgi:hypothetical protein
MDGQGVIVSSYLYVRKRVQLDKNRRFSQNLAQKYKWIAQNKTFSCILINVFA